MDSLPFPAFLPFFAIHVQMWSTKSLLTDLTVGSSAVILVGNAVRAERSFGESVGLQLLRSLTKPHQPHWTPGGSCYTICCSGEGFFLWPEGIVQRLSVVRGKYEDEYQMGLWPWTDKPSKLCWLILKGSAMRKPGMVSLCTLQLQLFSPSGCFQSTTCFRRWKR